MSEDDLTSFVFDKFFTDKQHKLRVDVTRCEADDDYVQLNFRHTDASQPAICFFVSLWAARKVGQALLDAATTVEEAV